MRDEDFIDRARALLSRIDPAGRMSPDDAMDYLLENLTGFEDLEPARRQAILSAALPSQTPRHVPPRGGAPARPAPTRPAPDAASLTAPYRFVVIEDQVVPAQEETKAAAYDLPIKGGYCGEVEVDWAFETPMGLRINPWST